DPRARAQSRPRIDLNCSSGRTCLIFKGELMAKTAQKKPARKADALVTPSPALAKIIGSESMTRTEVTNRVWDYIRKNNLQDPNNKRLINADAALKAVFDGKSPVTMFEMTKLVSRHLK